MAGHSGLDLIYKMDSRLDVIGAEKMHDVKVVAAFAKVMFNAWKPSRILYIYISSSSFSPLGRLTFSF